VGSYLTKAGFAGEDSPKAVFPTMTGYLEQQNTHIVGDTEIVCPRDSMEIRAVTKQSLVEDWDGLEKIWDYIFHQRLHIDPKDYPILYSVPPFATRDMREKIGELMFEKYQVPGLYLSKSAVLTAFAFGRSTALVFDAGHDMMSVTPVYEGYALKKHVMKQKLAGAYLNDQLESLLEEEMHIELNPYYLIASKEAVREDSLKNSRDVCFNI
jgi:actin-related protein